jgi:hypothetical protein
MEYLLINYSPFLSKTIGFTTTGNLQQVLVLFFQCIEAEIFGSVSSSIQVTEFTVSHDAPLLIAPLFFGYNCYFFP